ncbi:hypothetical protein JTE90_017141 [Oedothorax gibbosus]|uniref:MBT domain-containing protein 1 n=1 Tax=Oedothorax gibbosus TaxID=931172 RepID=A0AAV6UCT9_9ARAC|nr:hypothetical protein JTE90_017141 [Oedothorax gibbosus]
MTEGSYDWQKFLKKSNVEAVPVTCFKHVSMSKHWGPIKEGMFIEMKSSDCSECPPHSPCCFWVGVVIKITGYIGLVRWLGFDEDSSNDFYVNFCTEPHLHPLGWGAENGMPHVPPKCIEDKYSDWKDYLQKKIKSVPTISPDFPSRVEESKKSVIKRGMKLEVVDRNLISAVRVATVNKVIGGRLYLKYDGLPESDAGFWCHERSPLIHPIGWSQIVGHALRGSLEYAKQSLLKTLFQTHEPADATWEMFVPVPNPVKNMKFQPQMKLEAIDPLNLSTICVATVTEVLRNNYLMIGIDGMTEADGSDCFCYHASSPCIFWPGFCESNDLQLTPPRGYKGEFKWEDYFKKTKSKPAPKILFHRDVPNHGFQEGSFLEAVDLMDPRLICVAQVTKVVGRLLRIHFVGWEEAFDQWCDCESPDLYPVGWCDAMGYRLEPPRVVQEPCDSRKILKANTKNRRRRARMAFTVRKRHNVRDFDALSIKTEPVDSS